MEQNSKLNSPYATRLQIAICVALCPIFIVGYTLLSVFTELNSAFSAVFLTILYLSLVALIFSYKQKYVSHIPCENLEQLLSEDSSMVIKNTKTPSIIIDSYGTVLWYNSAMHSIIGETLGYIGQNVKTIFGDTLSGDNFTGKPISLFGNLYTIESYDITTNANGLYLLMLSDITELEQIKHLYESERTAVAYIAIDNVEDILQYVHDQFRNAISTVDDKIKVWAASMNGVVKSYDNDKYIMFFDSSRLEECIESRFDILDAIRDIKVGDGVSITASIGVSKIKGTLAERENAAREAIDMALQRGGDQAVYKTEDAIEYYGGRTKSLYKRSNVKTRIFTARLSALIARADNVIVMGHRYGDFDSIGASVGIVRLAMLLGAKANIAIDMRDANLLPCIEMMQNCPGYSQVFVDRAEAFDIMSPDTLVVLVDHNKFERSQFSDISSNVQNVVMIDHHRKSDIMPETVGLYYIEPSASSTCELVTEMLEVAIMSQNIAKEEADLLLAGILLDTKQFTRNTGTRTFGAAQYLRGAGANPSDVYSMFKLSPLDLAKEARFHTSITVYKNNVAISSCDGDTDDSYRIIASKAADKMLTLQNIEAAFAVVKIGDIIHISGRSNGNINVQIILEKLNGGGHFDIAGAQIKSDSVISVLETLKESIDDYLELDGKNISNKSDNTQRRHI